MKKNIYATAFILTLVSLSFITFAQDDLLEPTKSSTPKWVSSLGYWVVESNILTPKHNIVYLYNDDNVLVYKETIEGILLKVHKRRMKMRLKKLVDQTVTAFQQKQKSSENEMLVWNMIK